MRRMSVLEAGFFTNCLDQAMSGPAEPFILNRSELKPDLADRSSH
jgi:hypothetical protein